MMGRKSCWSVAAFLTTLAVTLDAHAVQQTFARKNAQWARAKVLASWTAGKAPGRLLGHKLGRVHVLHEQREPSQSVAVAYEVDGTHVVTAAIARTSGEIKWLEHDGGVGRPHVAAARVSADWTELNPRGLSYSGQSAMFEQRRTHQLVSVPLGPGHAQLVRRGKTPRAPRPVAQP
jgi:hypothetical protein